MANQTSSPRPDTITHLQQSTDSGLAMLAGMQLDVFTPLKGGPMTLDEVAASLDVRPIKLRPLMYALVVAGLLNVDADKFSNTLEAEHFLVKDSPAYLGGIHGMMAYRLRSTLLTAESIITGIPQAKVDFSAASEDDLEKFLRRLQPDTMTCGQQLSDRWDFTSMRTLADVGGGSGGLAIAVTKKYPQLKATVIELPTVAPITQRIVTESGAGDRIDVVAADVLAGPLAGSYDVVALRALIQVLSPGDAVKALRNIREAVRPGGTIHIIGRLLDNSRVTPLFSVAFSMQALSQYDDGQAYTEQEYADWLAEAGFEGFERATLTGIDDVVTARNPG